jgi:hypothetical protein
MSLRQKINNVPRWPTVASTSSLPNVAGSPTQSAYLEVSDECWVTGSGLYICTVATLGAATWVLAASTVGVQDKYEAAIIVGNALAGDTTANCHYLDPGDGTGIAAAFAAALVLSPLLVDIYIRRGTYTSSVTLNPPSGCNIHGAGIGSTILKGPIATASQAGTVLDPGTNVTLSNMTVIVRDPATGNTANARGGIGISAGCTYRNLDVVLGDNTGTVVDATKLCFSYQGSPVIGGTTWENVSMRVANLTTFGTGSATYGIFLYSIAAAYTEPTSPNIVRNCSFTIPTGGAAGVGFLTNIYATVIDGFYAQGVNSACNVAGAQTITGTVRGPLIKNIDHDMRGVLSVSGYAVAVSAGGGGASTPTILGTHVSRVRAIASPTANTSHSLFVGSVGNGLTMQDVILSNLRMSNGGAGVGNVTMTVANTAGTNVEGLTVEGAYTKGDITLTVGASGTATSTILEGNTCRNLTLSGTTISRSIVVGNRITGVYTDSSPDAQVGLNSLG